MLIDKDGKSVKRKKKRKRRKSSYRKSFQLTFGIVLSVAAILCVVGVWGIGQITSRAVGELTFKTNSGAAMSGSSWTVMDGAQIAVADASSDVKIYYKFYTSQLADTSGISLKDSGTLYAGNTITLQKSAASAEGILYLYVQQFENDEAKRIDCYQILFYEKAAAVTATPETSDSEMTTLQVGDTIRFAGNGKLYYTMSETPYFERAGMGESGDLTINNETFKLGSSEMQQFGIGNTLTVPVEWLDKGVVTIRVIAAADGSDFSPVANFRYTIGKNQAAAPEISPVTTADSPVIVPDGTKATLSTATDGAVILYTTNGSVPSYTVAQNGSVYEVTPAAGSNIYQDRITVSGEPGGEFTITAIAVKIDEATGVKVMTDSEAVQYSYRFSELETAAAPESSPKAGTALSLGDKVYLSTESAGGVILYTTDGTSPSYTFDSTSGIVPASGTSIYGADSSNPCIIADAAAGAERGKDFLVQAKVICLDDSGEKLMEDSQVVQFSFPINDAETVAAPTAIPATTESKPTTVEEGDVILLSTTTSGARIYYTTDGSAPVLDDAGEPRNSATLLYSGQEKIVVPEGTGYLTITAMAVKEEMNDSSVVQFVYQYPQIVAPPYCSPAEGTVSINTEVELASLDSNALIYYTLDGTVPTALIGKLYSDPLLLTSTTTIKAICVVDGISSSVRTFTFTVSPELMPPSPSIASGSVVTSGTTIKLTAQSGAEIAYTTDGSNPKTGSPMSGDTVTITGNAGDTITLITYAKGANYSESQTATYVYTISSYENGIRVSPESGTSVRAGDVIKLETDVTNAAIYYACGGELPTASSAQGTQVIVPAAGDDDTFILKAVAVAGGTGFPNSAASFQYPYYLDLAVPKASIPDGAVLLKKQEVELTAEQGDIYYTTDGTWPDEYSSLYTDRIPVDEQMTILAYAMDEDGAKSEVVGFTYTFAAQAEKPQFSIQGGEVETGTRLTIRSETDGAQIYYTLDGTEPDPENPKNLYTYSGAISITKPMQIKAIAVKDKMTSSAVSGAIFTVKEPEPEITESEEEEKKTSSGGDRLMSRRSYLDGGSGTAYTDLVLKNAMTGVVISAREGTMPADVQVVVTEIATDSTLDRSIQEYSGKQYGAVAGYEVSVLQNGEPIVLSKDVEVGLPIPSKYRNCAIYLASVDEEGNVQLFDTRRDGDMAYAFTDQFGRYCVVAPTNLEEDGGAADYTWIIAGCTALLLLAGYLSLRFARKKGEADE